MAKVRQDAWSHEDDLLLAETVLRHIREGSTQLNAFEEVGDELNRTSAACGFRWNAEVRAKYDRAIDLAKRQRKERKRALAANTLESESPAFFINNEEENNIETIPEDTVQEKVQEKENNSRITMDVVIQYLKEMKKNYHASNQTKTSYERTKKENESLKEQINQLDKQLTDTQNQLATVKEDYQTFIQIMDRARKMTVLEDQGHISPPVFQMDKNGNLNHLANDGSSS